MKKFTLLAMSLMMALFVKAEYGVDITSQLTNPDFEDGSTGWSITGGNKIAATAANYGYNGTNFMEDWVPSSENLGDRSWSQTIDVPNGVYVLKALAHAVKQSDGSIVPTGVSIYANSDAVAVTSTNTNPPAEYSVYTQVTTGKLTVGYRIEKCNVNWAAWDNVRVTQYTAETMDEAMVMFAKDEMMYLAVEAEELIASKIQASLAAGMEASAAAIEKVTTWAEAEALWNTFKAQIEEAKASVEAYAALQAKLEQAYVWGEEGLSEGITEFMAAITTAEEIYDEAPLNVEDTRAAVVALDNAIFEFFMANADGELEYDMTDLHVNNPTLRSNNGGWTYNPEGTKAVVNSNIAEFFNCDFDMSQTIENLPNGMYVVYVTGYYRASSNDGNAGFNAHEAGTENITAELYANAASSKLACLYEHNVEEINAASPTDKTIGGWNNFANSMAEAAVCFDKDFYTNNKVSVIVTDGKLTFGLRNKNHVANCWTAFRDFKLGYLGNFPAVVLANALNEAQAWLGERAEVLPTSAAIELSEAISEAEPYSYVGDYENEEVLVILEQFEALFAGIKNVEALVEQLKGLLITIEDELIALGYPGAGALQEAYGVAAPYVEEAAEFDVEEGQTTEQVMQAVVAALQEAIATYYKSQVATRENPADYTFLLPNPNFEHKGDWTWSMTSGGSDLWNGGCRPSEDGGANRQGVNLWGWGITSVDVHQVLTGLPNGLYKVSAELITQANYATDQHVYAVGVSTTTSNALEVEGWDNYQWEELITNDFAVVIDGKLTIGVTASQGGQDSQGWFQATNFKLYYYGEASNEDLKGAWEASLARANDFTATLLSGDSKGVKAAVATATALAEAGKYIDACEALNPALNAADSVYNVTVKFYEGNYATVADYAATLDATAYAYSVQVAAGAKAMADQALKADDATYAILDGVDAKLGGYANYITNLVDSEDIIATIKGVKAEYITFVKDEVIAKQVADLCAEFRPAKDCEDLLAKLKAAMQALQSFNNLKKNVGDVTDLIINATIDDEAATGWTIVKGTGNGPTITGQHYDGTTTNRYIDSWAGSGLNFTAYQEIIGLPDGTYELKVAARSDGDNAYIFAAPNKLEADTAAWAATTQWDMVKKNGDKYGEIWYADSLAFVAADGAGEFPYFNANNGQGRGWSYNTITVEVTHHYLAIGITANNLLTCKEAFSGSWMGADDWTLKLVSKAATQSDHNPFTGVENIEVAPAVKGIYDLFGRRIDAPTATGIYIVDGKKTVIKK